MTETSSTTSTETTISAKDQKRIRNAMHAMRFSADSRVPVPRRSYGPYGAIDDVTVEDIVAFLSALNERLGDYVDSANADRRRLYSLEADVEAFRRLVGTAPAEVSK